MLLCFNDFMLLDTHCHLQFNGYDKNREEVIERCNQKRMILNIVGTQKDTSKKAVELAEKYDNYYATIGTHPIHLFASRVDEEESSFVSHEESFDEEYYTELAKSKKVIGVGETGLDLFHLPEGKSIKEVLEKQKEVFIAHINFAAKHNLPLVIHCRSAHDEMIKLLQSVIARSPNLIGTTSSRHGGISVPLQSTGQRDSDGSKDPRNDRKIHGVMHCFAGDWEQAKQYLDMGLYLGFTGVVTFPPKKTDPKPQNDLLEVLQKVPLDRILVETDAPYLAPQKYRGTFPSEPWMVEEVIKKIAEIRQKTVEEINQIVLENALNLFTGID